MADPRPHLPHILTIEEGWPPAYARAAGTDGNAECPIKKAEREPRARLYRTLGLELQLDVVGEDA
jgi:hypothetical protein